MLEAIRELKAENDSLKEQVKLQETKLSLIKDDQIRKLTQEVEELKKAQQKQIAQLASQVSIIQSALKAKPRTRSTARVAKAHLSATQSAASQANSAGGGSGM
jgi:hypothetical protein